jgi:hypothetical protein
MRRRSGRGFVLALDVILAFGAAVRAPPISRAGNGSDAPRESRFQSA